MERKGCSRNGGKLRVQKQEMHTLGLNPGGCHATG